MPYTLRASTLIPVLTSSLLCAFSFASSAKAQTNSSTTVLMPEDGGPLPRANMPVGGVDDGMSRQGQSHRASPNSLAPKSNTLGAPKPAPQTDKPVATKPQTPAEASPLDGLEYRWGGFLRMVGEVVENDEQFAHIGRNDGFRVATARFELRAKLKELSAVMSLEAAAGERNDFNDPNQEFRVMPRDLFLSYDLGALAELTAGRFKAPYDLGFIESSAGRTFIEAPLSTRGVAPTQGQEVLGFSPGRQLGLMLHRERIGLSKDGFDLGYALALTNGRTFTQMLNDNDRPAAYARFSMHYAQALSINLAGFIDARTVGELPNLFDEEVMGAEGSFSARFMHMKFQGQFVVSNTQFDTSGRPDVLSYGLHGHWSYTRWGFELAYRFSMLEPNADDLDDADMRMEHTIGLNYRSEDLPLVLMLNGTLAEEQSGRQVDNNRLSLMAQFSF